MSWSRTNSPRSIWQSTPNIGSTRRRAFAAQIYAELAAIKEDWTLALEAIDLAVEAGLQDVLWIDRCPLFDELLGDRRFEKYRSVVRARAHEVLEVLDASA